MDIQNIITAAKPLAKTYAPEIESKLCKLEAAMQSSALKIVVLGDFKAGKSTLINTLFLKEKLLPTDYQEATAVPTWLSSGTPCMETWLRNDDGSETMVNTRDSFTDEELAAAVTADSDEDRAEKAEKYSRVVVQKPAILPAGIVLVDTPGMNSTNTRIIVGTMAEAQSADAVLYVVRSKQLSEVELTRITDLAGKQTHHKLPVHIVLTIDPDQIAPGQVQNLRQTISAQLSNRGVKAAVSVFEFGRQSQSILDKVDTGFGGNFSGAAQVPTTENNSSIEESLLSFFNTEVQAGRTARVARDLAPLLYDLSGAIKSRLIVAGQSAEALKDIEGQMVDKRAEYQRVVKSLLTDVKGAQIQFAQSVELQLNKVRDAYIAELEKKDSCAAVLACLNDWRNNMPDRMQHIMELAKCELSEKINALSAKYKVELDNTLSLKDDNVKVEFGTFLDTVSKVPSWLVYTVDYLIFSWLSPFGMFNDAILRIIAGRLPLIKKLMPATLATNMAISQGRKVLTDIIDDIKKKLNEQLHEAFGKMNVALQDTLESTDVFGNLKEALEEARKGSLTSSQREALTAAAQEVEKWIADL